MFPEDESIRVPLILRQPGKLSAGKSSNLLVGTLDLMPTLLGLMGLQGPEDLHGRDLSSPILAGKEDAVESVPLFYYSGAQPWDRTWFGVYTHGYTYSYEVGKKEAHSDLNVLFDHAQDRWQLTNHFGAPDQKTKQARLDALTQSWLERFGNTGINGEKLMRACFGNERAPLYRKGDTGILAGRPIDRVKEG
jgi:arylsulfatase A-like enzyme